MIAGRPGRLERLPSDGDFAEGFQHPAIGHETATVADGHAAGRCSSPRMSVARRPAAATAAQTIRRL